MKSLGVFPALLALVLLGGTSALADTRVPVPEVPPAKAEAGPDQCVEPVDVMRKRHFEFILHQRDETMHRGIRTSKHSFKECINCHVVEDDAGQPVTYKDERHFCNSCHQYAAVNIDCFDCHASTPEEGRGAASGKTSLFGSVIKAPAEN